jgi:hypothetical protein
MTEMSYPRIRNAGNNLAAKSSMPPMCGQKE